jgi:hypothetical protein
MGKHVKKDEGDEEYKTLIGKINGKWGHDNIKIDLKQ